MWLRRLHSVSGLMPVGAFMLLQLSLHAKALEGRDRYVLALAHEPHGVVWSIFIGGGLALHVVVGLWLARSAPGRSYYARAWLRTLQRATGLITLGFLVYVGVMHWWPLHSGAISERDLYAHLTATLSATQYGIPFHALTTTIGLAALSFHFGNGTWSFANRSGLLRTAPVRRFAATITVALAIACFVAGARTTLLLATGWTFAHEPVVEGGNDCSTE